eukprot:1516806-Heterocapsa_arctica.AAC.1
MKELVGEHGGEQSREVIRDTPPGSSQHARLMPALSATPRKVAIGAIERVAELAEPGENEPARPA